MTLTWPTGKRATISEIQECVEAGWSQLLEELILDLVKLGWDGQIHQVKEKFGGLRFYIGAGSAAIFDRINEAEIKSRTVCETCGQPGKIRGTSWLYCSCDRCDPWSQLILQAR